MPDTDLPTPNLEDLLDTFYASVRADPLLGPVFTGAINDWPEHLARIEEFWSSMMFGSGRYKGNPVAKHFAHAAHMTPQNFERWLMIWSATTDEMLPAPLANAFQVKAHRIAESLQLAVEFATTAQRKTAIPQE